MALNKNGLTPKQMRFCEEYMIDMNGTQAAIRAGYSERTANEQASQLLAKLNIQAEIQRRTEAIHDSKVADAKEVMEYLTAVLRGEQRDQTLKSVGMGVQQITEVNVPARDRLKAAELLGKRYALFTDKTDVTVAQPIVISGGDALED